MAESNFLDIGDHGNIVKVLQKISPDESLKLGLRLGLLKPTLKKIEANVQRDYWLRECIACWLRKEDKVEESGGATVDSLISALEEEDLMNLEIQENIEKIRVTTTTHTASITHLHLAAPQEATGSRACHPLATTTIRTSDILRRQTAPSNISAPSPLKPTLQTAGETPVKLPPPPVKPKPVRTKRSPTTTEIPPVSAPPASTGTGYKLISLTTGKSVRKSVPLIYPNNMTYDVASNKLIPNGEKRSSLCICPVGMELLANIHKPIAVLSIAGPARTGKSYILSRLLDSHDAFELGHTQRAQTHGIWIGTQALEYDDRVLVLLDTEGIGAVSADSTNDAKILVMTLLMSSHFIYNSSGVPKTDDLNKMRVFTTLAHSIAVTSHSAAAQQDFIRHHFPNFLWLLRDFMLDIEDETGEEMTPREYLLREVLCTNDTKSELPESDKVRMAILNSFPTFDCFVLPVPSAKKQIIRNIATHHDKLEEEFTSGVAELITLLRNTVTAKKGFQSSEPIDGHTLALLAYSYIKALNLPDSVPCLDDTWVAVAKQKSAEIQNELVKRYQELMNQKIAEASEGRLPLEVEARKVEDASNSAIPTIMGIHRLVYGRLEKKLLRKVGQFITATDEFVQKQDQIVKEFEHALVQYEGLTVTGGVLSVFLHENEKQSKHYCTEIWQKYYQPIKGRIQSGDRSYTYQQYTEDFDRAREAYLSLARGPAKWAVLEEAEKDLQREKHYMEQLKGYEEESNQQKEETRKLNKRAQLAEERLHEEQVQRNEDSKKVLKTLENIQEETKRQNEVRQVELEERLRQEAKKQEDMKLAHMKELADNAQKNFEDLKREKEQSERRNIEMMKTMMEKFQQMQEIVENERKEFAKTVQEKERKLRESEGKRLQLQGKLEKVQDEKTKLEDQHEKSLREIHRDRNVERKKYEQSILSFKKAEEESANQLAALQEEKKKDEQDKAELNYEKAKLEQELKNANSEAKKKLQKEKDRLEEKEKALKKEADEKETLRKSLERERQESIKKQSNLENELQQKDKLKEETIKQITSDHEKQRQTLEREKNALLQKMKEEETNTKKTIEAIEDERDKAQQVQKNFEDKGVFSRAWYTVRGKKDKAFKVDDKKKK